MALTIAAARTGLDSALTGVTHVEWSTDGSTVTSRLAATAVTLESAADLTTYARKGISVASPPLLTAGLSAGAGVSITHWRFTTASTGGTAKTAWNALSSPAALVAGGQISLANTALYEKLTPA